MTDRDTVVTVPTSYPLHFEGQPLGQLSSTSGLHRTAQTPSIRQVLVQSYPVSLTFAPATTQRSVYVNTTNGGSPTHPRVTFIQRSRLELGARQYLPPTWTLSRNSSPKVGTSAQSPLPDSRSSSTLKWPSQEQPREADFFL